MALSLSSLYNELTYQAILLADEESTTTSQNLPSSSRPIPNTRSEQENHYGRAGSANPSSVGHESGFQSSASLTSLRPSLMAGSLYEWPISALSTSAMDNVGGSF